MKNNFSLYDFAKKVVYDLRSAEGRERFIYDDGSAHVSAEHQAVIDAMIGDGTFDREEFNRELVSANKAYALDLVEGRLDLGALPEGEGDLASLLDRIRQTGNDDLLDSAKEFARLLLEDEVESGAMRHGEKRFAVMTKASWVTRLPVAYNALSSALDGAPHLGLKDFAARMGNDDRGRAIRTAVKALMADIRDHLAAATPEVKAKSGLSATVGRAAAPGLDI